MRSALPRAIFSRSPGLRVVRSNPSAARFVRRDAARAALERGEGIVAPTSGQPAQRRGAHMLRRLQLADFRRGREAV